jgi:hypothetical protein
MSKKKFIQDLCEENSTFSSQRQAEMVANLLDTVSSDIYSESQRFVFELIQNADDAAKDTNNEIHFDFLPNCLIVSHNGKPFDENDIISLTGAGASTKRADSTKTGYKGIGFKSVFGKSERVTIFSDGYQFRFDKSAHKSKLPWQIIPIWTELNELNNSIQKSILDNKYAVSTTIEIKRPEELLNELNGLLSNGQILLFLRRVSKISLSYNGKPVSSIEKIIISQNSAFNEVTLYKDGKEISSWLTKTFEQISIPPDTKEELRQDEKTPEKLKDADYTELSFAAKIEDGKIKSLKSEESLIFTYLPTSVADFGFPFLVNGNFLTTASRQAIHSDRIWNQWLFKLVAEKIIKWIEILAANNKFRLQILHLLPRKFNNSNNELHISFDKTFESKVKDAVFIPTIDNNKLKKSNEVVVDKTGLSEIDFISNEILADFINLKEKTKFTKNSFVNSQLQKVERLKSIGTKFFEPDNLEEFFLSDTFKSSHETKDNFKLINYFYQIDQSDESKGWHEKLKTIPFIFGKGRILRPPTLICFPYKSDDNTEDGKKPTPIHKDVIPLIESNPEIKEWLRALGVKEYSDITFFEIEIIPNLETIIDDRNYKEITRYIFDLHKRNDLTYEHYQILSGLKLLCKDNSFHNAGDCFLSDFYAPILRLEKLYSDCNYVSESYKESYDDIAEWKLFFIKVGVSETISIKRLERISRAQLTADFQCDSRFFSEYSSAQGYSYGFYEYSLTKISFIEKAIDYKFSKLFWDVLLTSDVDFNQIKQESRGYWGFGGMSGSTHGDRLPSYTEWLMKKIAIIPTTMKSCLLPDQVFINSKDNLKIAGNYLPVFNYDSPIPNEWKELLPFIPTLSLENYLTVLEKIASQTEVDEELKMANRIRIGLIYEKISSGLSDYHVEEKETIKEWSTKNKLLSDTGIFENANELKWVKISGFSSSSERLKLIFIPDNIETDSDNFNQLLSLFGVQIIDQFIPKIKNAEQNASLKFQLQIILPFLVALIEKKQHKNSSIEYDRLSKIIDESEFYNAAEINLSFSNQGVLEEGSNLNSHLIENQLYFKGKWTSPLILYSLVPELSKLLLLTGLNEELKLLLQLDENEIKEWLIEQGIDLSNIQSKPEFSKAIEKIKEYTTEDGIEQSYDLVDNSDERSRISLSEEAKEQVFDILKQKGFQFQTNLDINYTIVRGIKHPNGTPIKVVVKSGKAGKIYFNPSEWLALTETNTQLFVVTRGNIVRNVTLQDLENINDTFHMRFNTQAFAVNTNLKAFANFFRYLKYTHFIFESPESTTDYLQQFGLCERNFSSKELSADDKNLLL